jgi:hypothetical protein
MATAGARCYAAVMTLALKGRVKAGRLLVDEPIDLPDGSEVDLIVVDDGDDLDDVERDRLHAALAEAGDEVERGEGIPAEQVIERLRRRR